MTWEETIQMIRTKEDYRDLVAHAYFDADLPLNIERFQASEEFSETLKIIRHYSPGATTILDIGSGNGVSAVSFAIKGYSVTAVEPDTSDTVGAGAIKKLKDHYKLDGLTVHASFAEDINFNDASFDIVYVRQAMHHANELNKFVAECLRVLKPKGLFLSVRDHVIYDTRDKEWFLENHPLQKFYGGENAYTCAEYKHAITNGGGVVKKEVAYYDSVINYSPLTTSHIENIKQKYLENIKNRFVKKAGVLAKIPFAFELYTFIKGIRGTDALDEKTIPGRMYTYIALKK